MHIEEMFFAPVFIKHLKPLFMATFYAALIPIVAGSVMIFVIIKNRPAKNH